MGKGPERRKEDFARVQRNWDGIDWKNTRRNKVQKMFPTEIGPSDTLACPICRGSGRNYLNPDIPRDQQPQCADCKGKGQVTIEEFRKILGIKS